MTNTAATDIFVSLYWPFSNTCGTALTASTC